MSRLSRILFLSATLGSGVSQLYAQGCSDAGFCTSGAMQSAAPASDSIARRLSSIAFSFTAGSGEQGTTILIPQLELVKSIGKKGFAELKLPYYYASGNLGRHAGMGDPLLTYTHEFIHRQQWSLYASGGVRISAGNAAARTDNDLPLPMPYQSNLGTTDIILGLSVGWKKYITVAAGYQQPVIQYNQNGYLPVSLPGAEQGYTDYFASRQLKRKGDVLFRAEGHYNWRKFSLSAGPLFIYHLGKDRISNAYDMDVTPDGSEGLTLNIAGNAAWTGRRWKADISAGTPLAVRSYRPDGLTREWVVTPRISYFFRKKIY